VISFIYLSKLFLVNIEGAEQPDKQKDTQFVGLNGEVLPQIFTYIKH